MTFPINRTVFPVAVKGESEAERISFEAGGGRATKGRTSLRELGSVDTRRRTIHGVNLSERERLWRAGSEKSREARPPRQLQSRSKEAKVNERDVRETIQCKAITRNARASTKGRGCVNGVSRVYKGKKTEENGD
jgi:hypothetical protein